MVFAMLLYFSVIPMMPIAEAGAGLFTSPIFVLLFSSFLFKEKMAGAVPCGFHWNNRCFTYNTAWIGRFFYLSFVAKSEPYALGSIITYRYLLTRVPWPFYFHFS